MNNTDTSSLRYKLIIFSIDMYRVNQISLWKIDILLFSLIIITVGTVMWYLIVNDWMERCSASGKEQKSQDSEMHVFDRETERIQCFFFLPGAYLPWLLNYELFCSGQSIDMTSSCAYHLCLVDWTRKLTRWWVLCHTLFAWSALTVMVLSDFTETVPTQMASRIIPCFNFSDSSGTWGSSSLLLWWGSSASRICSLGE